MENIWFDWEDSFIWNKQRKHKNKTLFQELTKRSQILSIDEACDIKFIVKEFNLTEIKIKQRRFLRNYKVDYSLVYLPKVFKSYTEALEVYNILSFPRGIQYMLYEIDKRNGLIEMFSLWWSSRGAETLLSSGNKFYFFNQTSPIWEWKVNIRFYWDHENKEYKRARFFNTYHNHITTISTKEILSESIISEITGMIISKPNLKITDIIQEIGRNYIEKIWITQILDLVRGKNDRDHSIKVLGYYKNAF